MRATGPRGILIEQIRLNSRSTLRVTMGGVLLGKGHCTLAELSDDDPMTLALRRLLHERLRRERPST
jgi:hypothetical protein